MLNTELQELLHSSIALGELHDSFTPGLANKLFFVPEYNSPPPGSTELLSPISIGEDGLKIHIVQHDDKVFVKVNTVAGALQFGSKVVYYSMDCIDTWPILVAVDAVVLSIIHEALTSWGRDPSIEVNTRMEMYQELRNANFEDREDECTCRLCVFNGILMGSIEDFPADLNDGIIVAKSDGKTFVIKGSPKQDESNIMRQLALSAHMLTMTPRLLAVEQQQMLAAMPRELAWENE